MMVGIELASDIPAFAGEGKICGGAVHEFIARRGRAGHSHGDAYHPAAARVESPAGRSR